MKNPHIIKWKRNYINQCDIGGLYEALTQFKRVPHIEEGASLNKCALLHKSFLVNKASLITETASIKEAAS